jgi:type I restriction enzyme S subunit
MQELPVASITRGRGLVPQSEIFKKEIASRDVSKYRVVCKDQVVVGIHVDEGAIGVSALEEDHIVSPAYSVWSVKDHAFVYPKYLGKFLRSPRALQYFVDNYRRTADRRGKLTQDKFFALPVPLPPIEEQRRIAAVLDKTDELEAKRRVALAMLDNLAEATFIEMFGDPASNQKGWPSVELVSLADGSDGIRCGPFGTQLGKNDYRDSGVPLWGIRQVNTGFSVNTDEYLTPAKAQELVGYTLLGGDIVMTRKGTVGKCAVYPDQFPIGVMHSDLLRIRLNSFADPAFISFQLRHSREITRQISLISGGAVMAGINVTKLKAIQVLDPPLSLQRKFGEHLAINDGLKERNRSALARHIELFARLQQQAFQAAL